VRLGAAAGRDRHQLQMDPGRTGRLRGHAHRIEQALLALVSAGIVRG
jgi:hypothetical protein